MNEIIGEIDCDGPDWKIGEAKVRKIKVRALNFVQFGAAVASAVRNQANASGSGTASPADFRKVLLRERRRIQMTAHDAKGAQIDIDDLAMMAMPRPYGVRLTDMLDASEAKPGVVVKDKKGNVGDGLTTPMLYQMGTPIKLKSAAAGQEAEPAAIVKLDFLAPTLGDVENVQAETIPLLQTLALIRDCATPIIQGGSSTAKLQRLPSWALDEITVTDGLMIMEHVLPVFQK